MPRAVTPCALAVVVALAPRVCRGDDHPRRWGEASVSLDAVALLPSAYGDALRDFGWDPPTWALAVSARVLRTVRPRLLVGGRFGWMWARATGAPASPSSFFGGTPPEPPTFIFRVYDLSAVMRLVAVNPSLETPVSLHLDVEAGAALGTVALLDVTQYWVRPQLGTAVGVGFRDDATGLLYSFRVGFQFLPWGGAGGSALDPAFSGFRVGFEVGGLP